MNKAFNYRSLKRNRELYDMVFTKKLEKQNGQCYICKNRELLYLDHDHETGLTRQLLCKRCNLGLGLLKDDISLMMEAIKYLQNNS